MIALLSINDRISDQSLKISAISLVAGVVLAVLTALYSALGSKTGFGAIGANIGYWSEVAVDGIRTPEHEKTLDTMQKATVRVQIRTVAIGLLSLGCFVIGVGSAMVGFQPRPIPVLDQPTDAQLPQARSNKQHSPDAAKSPTG